jgi:hypothetical protein
MDGRNNMKKWYKAKIRNNIPDDFNCIPEIKQFAGKYIYVNYNENDITNYFGRFLGRVNNITPERWWREECFSEMIEI